MKKKEPVFHIKQIAKTKVVIRRSIKNGSADTQTNLDGYKPIQAEITITLTINALLSKKPIDNRLLIGYRYMEMKHIVKIEKTERQVRVTIPKILAKNAGLQGRRYCIMELNEHGNVEIRRFEVGEIIEGHIQKSAVKSD